MAPTETPFVKRMKGGWGAFEVSGQRSHEWVEDDLWKNRLTVSSTTGLTATDGTTLTLSANDAFRVSPGTVLQIESEKVLVTAIASASTLTIVRDIGGTTAATHATATTVYMAGIARDEGSDSPYIGNAIKTWFTNYVQFFDVAFQLSEQAMHLDSYGQASELNRQRDRTTKHLASLAEVGAIRGTANAGAANDPAMFGGILHFLTTANGAYNTALSAALAESNLYTGIRSIMDNVGESYVARTIIVRHFLRQKISGFFENRIRTEVGDHTGGVSVSALETDFGRFEIMHSYNWPEDVVGFINFDKIRLGHYRGLPPWREKRLAEAGAYQRHEIYGETTLEISNPQCMGQITAVTLS